MLWLALTLPCPTLAASPGSESNGEPVGSPIAEPIDWPALACWAGRFTPRVTLADGLLRLEVAGSLRLFGGLDALLAILREDIQRFPQPFILAVAATPRAAFWLARGGNEMICLTAQQTQAALSRLPLAVLPLSAEIASRLTGFGLRRLGEVLRLPRAALGTRLGKGFVLDLARALGEVDEPLPWFEFPETFAATLELPAPVEAASVLLFAARRLIVSLSGWLAARNVALREMHWSIDHGHVDSTELPLRFSTPVHARERIERVLKEALDRLSLRAPALALRLRAENAEVRDARSALLFDSAVSTSGDERIAELLDRLVARLGQAAVVNLRCHADYRPELATQSAMANAQSEKVGVTVSGNPFSGTGGTASASAARPLRLLNVPRALPERQGRPFCDGPLTLLAGPERIETGWWDGVDARRDYFIALDQRQRWLWLFRTGQAGHDSAGWFLHGEFV